MDVDLTNLIAVELVNGIVFLLCIVRSPCKSDNMGPVRAACLDLQEGSPPSRV